MLKFRLLYEIERMDSTKYQAQLVVEADRIDHAVHEEPAFAFSPTTKTVEVLRIEKVSADTPVG
jgi:hypothetical protein